jgi:DNA-binding PadR family transcriptional regulator
MESLIWFVYSGQIYYAIKAELNLGELDLRCLLAVHYSHKPTTVNMITLETNNSVNFSEKKNALREILSRLVEKGLLGTTEGKSSATIYFVAPKGLEAIAQIGRICQSIIPNIYQSF